eukprot:2586107-Rhodomonas_salina.1
MLGLGRGVGGHGAAAHARGCVAHQPDPRLVLSCVQCGRWRRFSLLGRVSKVVWAADVSAEHRARAEDRGRQGRKGRGFLLV